MGEFHKMIQRLSANTVNERWLRDRCAEIAAKADARIAALEAEKEARERQEPVAWVVEWMPTYGSGIAREFYESEKFARMLQTTLSNAEPAMQSASAPLYYAPPVPHVDPDWLANVIRTVDGNHTMGAGAMAEKIAEAINGRAK